MDTYLGITHSGRIKFMKEADLTNKSDLSVLILLIDSKQSIVKELVLSLNFTNTLN